MTAARLTLAGLAAMWCGDERFQRWLGVDGSAAARDKLLAQCGITSRRELDSDPLAAKTFHSEIRLPYTAHLKADDGR